MSKPLGLPVGEKSLRALRPRRQLLHIGPLPRKVLPPQSERAVLRGGGEHGARGVPGYAPHGGFGGEDLHVFVDQLVVGLFAQPMNLSRHAHIQGHVMGSTCHNRHWDIPARVGHGGGKGKMGPPRDRKGDVVDYRNQVVMEGAP